MLPKAVSSAHALNPELFRSTEGFYSIIILCGKIPTYMHLDLYAKYSCADWFWLRQKQF